MAMSETGTLLSEMLIFFQCRPADPGLLYIRLFPFLDFLLTIFKAARSGPACNQRWRIVTAVEGFSPGLPSHSGYIRAASLCQVVYS